jgi:hypothetical protein
MGGGLMQLVAYGAQDVYLSGNPQITFFKVVYRRHTNFAVEPIPQTWNGSADFGRTVTCNINRNGDLITNMYLCVKLAETTANDVPWGYVNRLGHAIVQDVKIEIGGSKIDEHYADWLNIWYELTHETSQERGYAKMIGDDESLTTVTTDIKLAYIMYVPLIFWFNRNNGLALPLIALQYHDVRITLVYNSFSKCVNYQGIVAPVVTSPMTDSFLVIDYVYLDSEERKRFAQASHEYLIEQLQFTGSESLTSVSNKYRLNFNHPCKYLVWAPHFDLFQDAKLWLAYAFDGDWAAAKDYFAKVLTVMTSELSITNKIVTAAYETTSGSEGALAPLTVSTEISSYLSTLVSKVDVQWSVDTPSAGVNTLGSIATQDDINALFGNAIVTRNNLSMSDITELASTIYDALNITDATFAGFAKTFAQAVGFTVINQFNYGNYIDESNNPVYDAKLQLNGHDRFQARDGFYFNYVQPYQHFTHTPADGINVYSFALKAEDHQPTGSCNFSRIDNATLNVSVGYNNSNADSADYIKTYLTSASSVMNIYTMNYNVLRVMSGMAGTAYSN